MTDTSTPQFPSVLLGADGPWREQAVQGCAQAAPAAPPSPAELGAAAARAAQARAGARAARELLESDGLTWGAAARAGLVIGGYALEIGLAVIERAGPLARDAAVAWIESKLNEGR